jgi:YhcH/YjgK/YiaL family protein
MIYDFLSNADCYRDVKPGIARAFEYLRQADFANVAVGKYELDGARLYAMVQRYTTKTFDAAVWESHRKYIDVQYVCQGEEWFGYVPLSLAPAVTTPYDEGKEAQFYAPGSLTMPLRAGQFAVFFPQDIHAPCLAGPAGPAEVVKVVVKVAI